MLAWWPDPDEVVFAIRRAKINRRVAPSVSQGSTRRKVCAGVFRRSSAPPSPPAALAANNAISTRRGLFRRLRYAPPLAAAAVQSAIVLVALAGMAGPAATNQSRGGAAT